jgi:hypothetical protein
VCRRAWSFAFGVLPRDMGGLVIGFVRGVFVDEIVRVMAR